MQWCCKTHLHEITARLLSCGSERNLERHLAHGEPTVVTARVLLQDQFKVFSFLHEELDNFIALRGRRITIDYSSIAYLCHACSCSWMLDMMECEPVVAAQ